jgi:ABC-type transport system involved in multi-copper enzyme maturation permease subunit
LAVRARRHIGVLIRHDLRYTLSSARGLLFLVFFGLVWGGVLWKLAGGFAEKLGTPQAGFLLSWMFDSKIAQLFQDRPPTLAAYFWIAMTLTPLFGILAACDQTASDLGTRHIRFLIPRVGRAEIFVARLISAAIVFTLAQLLAGIAATIIAVVVHGDTGAGTTGTGAIISYGAGVTASLIAYSLPIVALMSLVSAAMGSIGLALLVGLGGYMILLIPSLLPLGETLATIVSFLVPSGLKPYLLRSEIGPALAAGAGALAYVALYSFIGWQVFRQRDA